ncbi:MAG: cytochrome C [Chromatocurvus sp.]
MTPTAHLKPLVFGTLVALALAVSPLRAQEPEGYLDDYLPVDNALLVDVPEPARNVDDPDVQRGRYLTGLLGCASCHTDGALLGAPDTDRSLAGSRVGIAISDPMRERYPAIVYPPNITPHDNTGIGAWTESELVSLLRGGMDRHGGRALPVMPWQNYARLKTSDALAIARYLQNIEPVDHRVPRRVSEGTPAPAPYIHVGLYQRRQ